MAERLSGPAAERFAGDHWSPGPHGLPVLAGGTALLVARIVERVHVHDAIVVVVRVEDGGAGRGRRAARLPRAPLPSAGRRRLRRGDRRPPVRITPCVSPGSSGPSSDLSSP
ncbi:flavin reductase [Clavibacter zhangzhiyongii]|uniref:flavin reductase n=1 Tax=Clavibacter zhangzhiyongii TaxID=2768071 RepID=UPI0039DFB6BB